MTKLIKALIAGLVLIIVGLCLYIYFKPNPIKKEESKIEQLAKEQIQAEAVKIKDKVDKNGLTHVIYETVKELDHDAINKVKSELLDTIEQLGIAKEKLRQVMVLNTKLSIRNENLEKSKGLNETIYSHKDAFANVTVRIPDDSTKKATFDLGYDANLVSYQYNDRKWFLGMGHNYLGVYSNDTRFSTGGAKFLAVKQKEPPVVLKVQASSTYISEMQTALVGTSASVEIGRRLNIQGKYMYNIASNQWGWVVDGNYTIFGGR